ncbi:hypothetical protein NU688_33700 [Variovorax sp. ZS18.2.2]|uniref:hypothetical protein n=1 Tax=Variovorax sp. ZS18.2.2 TaxID=2971255 RepID=UPI002151A344|nr:hypothetical protein [Variovorax sp. ZS18.2.2]MCR6481154.1 hypothetical protein [Variovorax sp. ZS18.2.2]
MALTISEDQIATTNLLTYVSFLLLKRGTTDVANEIHTIAVLPAFYGRDTPAKPTSHEQLFIEVDEPGDATAVARVRLALTERFKALGHPRTI